MGCGGRSANVMALALVCAGAVAAMAMGVKVAVGAVVPSAVAVGGKNVAVMMMGSGVKGGKGFSGVYGSRPIIATNAPMPIVASRNTTVNRLAKICFPPEAGAGREGFTARLG